LSVPATLHASLMARLDRLGPAAKDVAQTGAAIGREFEYGLLASTTDLPEPQLRDALDRLRNAGLLSTRGTPPQASYSFKHALVQDAAYGTLLRSRRQRLHVRIVGELESQNSDIVLNNPERLARHCLEAGQFEKAIEYWRGAAETSISRSANIEAVHQTERALEVLRGLPESAERNARELRLLVPRGVGLQALHGYGSQQVHANYARANEICQTVSDIPELIPVLRGLYVHHLMQGSLPAAHEIGRHLLRLADQTDDEGWRLDFRPCV
jgi:predicted ATPase